MDEALNFVYYYLKGERGEAILGALVTLIVGLIVARLVRSALIRILAVRASSAHSAVVGRLVWVLVVFVVVLATLKQLGLDMSVLLGAAGILTVALGFASQTSASNLISGLFLLGERPFVIGDLVKVGEFTGEVVSIDLLAVKIRTFDNLFVRVPNEKLLKSEITTLTRYPIRRLDLLLKVAYKEDLGGLRNVLKQVAARNPLCLDEPDPVMIFKGFKESGQLVQFSVWAAREKWFELHNTLPEEIKRALDEAGIEIPFPHRTLYTGNVTEPFPVQLVESSKTTIEAETSR